MIIGLVIGDVILSTEVTITNEGNEIKLVWYGHSCFKIEIGESLLFFDPVRKNDMLLTFLKPQIERKANAIFISHEHWDHFDADTILALSSPSSKIYCPISVVGDLTHKMTFEVSNLKEFWDSTEKIVPVKKDDMIEQNDFKIKCLQASEGFSFLVIAKYNKILFMGDSIATNDMVKESPNIILFPVWAVRGEEANLEKFIELAKEKICIPMHYHSSINALPNFFIEPDEIGRLLPRNMNLNPLEKNRTYQF